MSFFTNEDITIALSMQIESALAGQDIKVFTIDHPKTHEPVLFIRVNNPPIPQYKGEATLYGKALRLLYSVQKVRSIISPLTAFNINTVAVTEAKTSSQANQSNTITFPTGQLKLIFEPLPTMNDSQCDEYIAHLIKIHTK
jgi:hypothetical protein